MILLTGVEFRADPACHLHNQAPSTGEECLGRSSRHFPSVIHDVSIRPSVTCYRLCRGTNLRVPQRSFQSPLRFGTSNGRNLVDVLKLPMKCRRRLTLFGKTRDQQTRHYPGFAPTEGNARARGPCGPSYHGTTDGNIEGRTASRVFPDSCCPRSQPAPALGHNILVFSSPSP